MAPQTRAAALALLVLLAASQLAAALEVPFGSRFSGAVSFQTHASSGFFSATVSVGADLKVFDNNPQCDDSLTVPLATLSFTFSWTDLIPGVEAGKCVIDTGKVAYTLATELGSCLRVGDDINSLVDAAEHARECPLRLGNAVQTFRGDLSSCESIIKKAAQLAADCSRAETKRVALAAEEDPAQTAQLMATCKAMSGVSNASPYTKSMDVWHTGVYVLIGAVCALLVATVVLGTKLYRMRKAAVATAAERPAEYVELQ
jgi:hypothetical protein